MEFHDEQKQQIVLTLSGTGDDGFDLAAQFGCELDEIETVMCEAGYERCVVCDWWFETHELNDDHICEGCR